MNKSKEFNQILCHLKNKIKIIEFNILMIFINNVSPKNKNIIELNQQHTKTVITKVKKNQISTTQLSDQIY